MLYQYATSQFFVYYWATWKIQNNIVFYSFSIYFPHYFPYIHTWPFLASSLRWVLLHCLAYTCPDSPICPWFLLFFSSTGVDKSFAPFLSGKVSNKASFQVFPSEATAATIRKTCRNTLGKDGGGRGGCDHALNNNDKRGRKWNLTSPHPYLI